jgi:hypothetical protein
MWYYLLNNQPQGPYDEVALQQLLAANRITPTILVWQEGMENWVPLQNTNLKAIVPVQPAMPAAPPRAPQPVPVAVPKDEVKSISDLFMWFWICLAAGFPLSFIFIGIIPLIASVVLYFILLYRFWDAIKDGNPRTSPGQAVGFMFIPFFNFYWMFVAIHGLAQDLNKYTQGRGIPAPKAEEGMALALCILSIVNIVPYLNFITGIATLILGIIVWNNFKNVVIEIYKYKKAAYPPA